MLTAAHGEVGVDRVPPPVLPISVNAALGTHHLARAPALERAEGEVKRLEFVLK